MKKILFLSLVGAMLIGCSENPVAPEPPISTSVSSDPVEGPTDCYEWTAAAGFVWVPCN